MIFGQSDNYVELFKILSEKGLIGLVLSVIAICGIVCLAALWIMKDFFSSSQKFGETTNVLAEKVSAINARFEVVNTKQDAQLAEHENRLDNHEVRIVTLETHPAGPGADMPLKNARGSRSPRRGSEEGGNQ